MARIVQVGLGPLGVRAAREFLERGMGRITGAVDPAHAGRPLAELVEAADPSLTIAPDVTALGCWGDTDAAIVTTRSALPDCFETLRDLLGLGVHVVSSCEELSYPGSSTRS